MAEALALEAAVARVTPPIPEVAVIGTRGLVRVEIREGRALAFSFSFIEAVVLLVLITRRVYRGRKENESNIPQTEKNNLQECWKTFFAGSLE